MSYSFPLVGYTFIFQHLFYRQVFRLHHSHGLIYFYIFKMGHKTEASNKANAGVRTRRENTVEVFILLTILLLLLGQFFTKKLLLVGLLLSRVSFICSLPAFLVLMPRFSFFLPFVAHLFSFSLNTNRKESEKTVLRSWQNKTSLSQGSQWRIRRCECK